MTIGEQLKDARKVGFGLSQAKLAEEVKSTQPIISAIETNRPAETTREKLEFIFDYMGIPYTNKDIQEVLEGKQEGGSEVAEEGPEVKQVTLPKVVEPMKKTVEKSVPDKAVGIEELKKTTIETLIDCLGEDDERNKGVVTALKAIRELHKNI